MHFSSNNDNRLTRVLETVMPVPGGGIAGAITRRCRARRFAWFEELAATLPRPLRVIDLGGKPDFWATAGWANRADVHITVLNIVEQPCAYANMRTIVGDATNLINMPDDCFDLAFSNSVIEHLFTAARQAAMAREIQRVATAFWLQTPNFWFPIEPHFYVPTWQWWPVSWRVTALQHMRCGCRGRVPDPDRARRIVEEIRLLSGRELHRMFPRATIVPERIAGLTKSWIVHDGFEAPAVSTHQTLRKAA